MKKEYIAPAIYNVKMRLEKGVMNTATLPVKPTDDGVDIWDAEGKESGGIEYDLWGDFDDEE